MFGSLFDKKVFFFDFLQEKDTRTYEEFVRFEKMIEIYGTRWQKDFIEYNTDRIYEVFGDEISRQAEKAAVLHGTLKSFRKEKITLDIAEKKYKDEYFKQEYDEIIKFFKALPKRLEVYEVYDKFDGTDDIKRILQLLEEYSNKSKKYTLSKEVISQMNTTKNILNDKKEVFGDYFNPKAFFPDDAREKMMKLKKKSDTYHENYIALKREYIHILMASLDEIIDIGKESVRKYRDQLMTILTMIQSENSAEIEKTAREGINFINQRVIALRKLKKALEGALASEEKVAKTNLETIRKSMTELVPTVVKSDTFLANKINWAARALKGGAI